MHPLLAERRGLSMYVGGWLVIAAGLVALVMRLEPRPPGDAVLLVAPLALVYAFICLSAWWVCRAIPLGRTSAERLAVFVVGASLQAGAAWTAIGAGWAWFLRARFGVPAGADDRWFLFAVGVVLYLVSIAFHYAWMALAGVRAAERRLLGSRVAARG